MANPSRPNILLITTDQQRHDTIAALGNPVIRTPTLDRLCAQGTAFTRCYTPSPVCVPARAALATGQPPHRTGCVDNGCPPDADLPSFMQRLADAGYQGHGIGKMHFSPDPVSLWGFESRDVSEEGYPGTDDFRAMLAERGYGHVHEPHGIRSEYYYVPQPSQLPAELHNTAWVADRSIDFLSRRDRDRPFLLWSSFIKPHPPFESPTPWNKLYRTAEMAAPRRLECQADLWSYWNRSQNRYKYRDHGYDELLWRTIRAAYYACISFIDYHVGRLLDALGDEADNTLIVFTSDHGEYLGDYGCSGKRGMLDVAARVPMLASWPGHLPAGARCETPATLLDVMPTFLQAAGIESEQGACEGVSLTELAAGDHGDRTVYSQFQRRGFGLHMAATRTGKYIWSEPDQREWYFDLERDPHEQQDRAGNPMHADEAATLRKRLIERYRGDGYTEALDDAGQAWRSYPRRSLPQSPDAGLLFQDSPGTQARIDALGPGYARPVTADPAAAMRMLKTMDPSD